MENNNTVKFNIENVKIEDSVSIEKASIEVSYDTEMLIQTMKTLSEIIGQGTVGKILIELIDLRKKDQQLRRDELRREIR